MNGPVTSPAELTLVAEHQRCHGAMYDAHNHGRIHTDRLRRSLASLLLPRAADGRIVLAVDVSPWLRLDAPTSPNRLFRHVYGRSRNASQFIPGRPYSFVAALETGRTCWTAVLDAVRSGPADDATAVTAAQLREVMGRLTPARVRRGFRHLRAKTACPASAPKPSRPGPGRPPGSKNHRPALRHEVGKTVKRAVTLTEHRNWTG